MSKELENIREGILKGDMTLVSENVTSALENGLMPKSILDEALISTMEEVGKLFEEGEYFVPEMLVAARAMKAGLEILKPKLLEENVQTNGKVAIGTVKGDLHDIGKNLVAIMLEGAGYEIFDLGVDVSPESFIEIIEKEGVEIIALSALLTTTMANMEATIKAIEDSGYGDKVKVIVGGAPVTEDYAVSIGAKGFAVDASVAVSVVKSLLS